MNATARRRANVTEMHGDHALRSGSKDDCHGRGLLLGSLVDVLLNNIHFMFKLFDFVRAEQWILFINT